jgi:DNA-binding HxlR family transcriptional regulator
MSNVAAIEKLDPVIHPPARLKIMAVLAPQDSLSFTELKEQLGMTDGNLCVHMRTLEEAGYVSVRKSFVNRKPRTEYSLTPKGRGAFVEYLQTLGEIAKQAQPAEEPQAAGHRELRPVLQQGIATAK